MIYLERNLEFRKQMTSEKLLIENCNCLWVLQAQMSRSTGMGAVNVAPECLNCKQCLGSGLTCRVSHHQTSDKTYFTLV